MEIIMLKGKNTNHTHCRITSLLLALAILMCCLSACTGVRSEVETPILSCKNQQISLSFYEFLLSRMRGTLARNKYEVTSPDFWAEKTGSGQESYEEYFNSSILESCKNYLAALVIFEEEGLKLSEATLSEIDEEIAFYIDYDGNKSEEKFNALISKYGVDTDSLREAYINEAKYEMVINRLYGTDAYLVSSEVKEEYYQDNYYRFKQILITNFYYEYERDAEGNIIYFDTESGEPLYDNVNGKKVYDENGNSIRDSYGNPVYFDANGQILYDAENGAPSIVLDENGEGKQYFYTNAEMAERKDKAEDIYANLEEGNFTDFELKISEHSDALGTDTYSDGFYLSEISKNTYGGYMNDIFNSLSDMEIGETAFVETEYGYHIIMRYALDEGKYADSKYAEWFESFNSSLIDKLFLDRAAKLFSEIEVNEENLALATSIKSIGTNFNY